MFVPSLSWQIDHFEYKMALKMRVLTEVAPAEVVEDERDDVEDEAEAQLLAHAPAVREVTRGELEQVASYLLDGNKHADLTK